jgi:hypothetical protein
MLKLLRISVLLYVLAFVAVGTWVTSRETTDWDLPLHVHVYAVAGDDSPLVNESIAALDVESFAAIERFFADEAQRYGVPLDTPFTFYAPVAAAVTLPPMPAPDSPLRVIAWSLKMRWLATRLKWGASDPLAPDITLFVVFHEGVENVALDRSTALRKGLIAVANVYAAPASRRQNDIVIAHELLHTLGATDKYSLVDGLPRYPEGFADPAVTRYPQSHAELMAGRRPIDARTAEIPESLRRVVVGPLTASEIGWTDAAAPTNSGHPAIMTASD